MTTGGENADENVSQSFVSQQAPDTMYHGCEFASTVTRTSTTSPDYFSTQSWKQPRASWRQSTH